MSVLEVRGVSKRFGGLQALAGVDLTAEAGQITALIGPNGAGKTTLFNCISGALAPDTGTVTLDGERLDELDVHARATAGLGRTFQRLEVFSNMTVFENLQVAAESRSPGRLWRGLLQWSDRPDDDVRDVVERTLARVGLEDVARTRAGDLSTGRLRMLELGRTLCTQPKVLLLDEPASGLDSDETEHFERFVVELAEEGYAVLLVEHDVELVLEVSAHVFCLDHGRMIADGPPAEIEQDPDVRAAYLGVDDEETEEEAADAPVA